jgi:hypothetical protein
MMFFPRSEHCMRLTSYGGTSVPAKHKNNPLRAKKRSGVTSVVIGAWEYSGY